MKCEDAALFLLLLVQQCLQSFAHTVLMSTYGTIGGSNYTYYTLARTSKDQKYTIILQTTVGDADLYVSDKSSYPTFEDYELKSETCGEDAIEIPMDFQRPVYIGVYGHPSAEESKYTITVVTDASSNTYESIANSFISPPPVVNTNKPNEEGEESLLWTVFVSVLKILFDILVS